MSRNSFFGNVIDRATWVVIQERLAEALRMEIHTLGPDGEDLCEPSRITRFRHYLNQSSAMRAAVPSSRRDFIRRTGESRQIVVDTSMTYRLHFSVPILFADEHVATVYGGGTVPEPLAPALVHELATRFSLDAAALAEVAADLPVAGYPVVLAAAQVIESLLSRIIEAVAQRERAHAEARQMEVLARVARTVTSSLDLLRTLDAVVEAVPQVMDVKASVVALSDPADDSLHIRAGRGVSDEFLQRVQFAPGEGLFGYVMQTGEAVRVADMWQDPRNAHREMDAREGLRALLAVPLRESGETLGVIGVFYGEPHEFDLDEQHLLEQFADHAASAVRNAMLYQEVRGAYRELGMANRLLSQAQDKLFHSDRLAQLGLVAGGAAHEMRNTLGGIIGAAATVRDRLGELSDDDVRELLAGIAEECWRLRDSIEAIRQFAKPVHYGMGRYRLDEIIADAVRLIKFDRNFRFVPFTMDCPAELEVVCDRDRIKQVLTNLLRNAAEATLSVADRPARIEVSAASDSEEVRIVVADNGCGIAEEDLERVWDAFYSTKGASGTGLGLETVRQIVERHSGRVEVVSEVGVGTTFTVVLPREGGGGER
ncbi:MAG: GAF domain-containing protein [Armatimonadetes bacterium]|nr:GAF domain-containing protein [Armatimonadota bacterium]